MDTIKLAICDDHEKFRKTIASILDNEPDFEIVLHAKNGMELLKSLPEVSVDVLLLDVNMPRMNGVETTQRLQKGYPELKIVAFSQYDSEENIIQMNRQGVRSFIGKEDDMNELFNAIRIVAGGGVYMTTRAARIVQSRLSDVRTKEQPDYPGNERQTEAPPFGTTFSDNEKRVAELICQGLSSTDISKVIFKSPRTVEKYRNDLYLKLNVSDKKGLIKIVSELIYRRRFN